MAVGIGKNMGYIISLLHYIKPLIIQNKMSAYYTNVS